MPVFSILQGILYQIVLVKSLFLNNNCLIANFLLCVPVPVEEFEEKLFLANRFRRDRQIYHNAIFI